METLVDELKDLYLVQENQECDSEFEIIDDYKQFDMSKVKNIVVSDSKIRGGAPVFKGTRIPLNALFDRLEVGNSIEDFLRGYPKIRREDVIEVIRASKYLFLSYQTN